MLPRRHFRIRGPAAHCGGVIVSVKQPRRRCYPVSEAEQRAATVAPMLIQCDLPARQ